MNYLSTKSALLCLVSSLLIVGCSHSASSTTAASNPTAPLPTSSGNSPQSQPSSPTATPRGSTSTKVSKVSKSSPTAPVDSNGMYNLILNPKPGKVDTYTVTTDKPMKSGKPVESVFYLKVSYTPISANKIKRTTQITGFDFSKVLNLAPGNQRAKIQKNLQAQAAAIERLKTVEDLTKHGRFIDISLIGGPKGMQKPSETQGISIIVFPKHPVKIGDQWQSPLGQDEVQCTLVKVDTENGKKIAVIDVQPVIAPSSTIKIDRIVRFNLADGTLESSSINQTQSVNGKVYVAKTLVQHN